MSRPEKKRFPDGQQQQAISIYFFLEGLGFIVSGLGFRVQGLAFGGSWVVTSGVMSPRIGHIIIITLLITPLITIHEPPSRVYGVCRVCKVCRAGRVCSIGFCRAYIVCRACKVCRVLFTEFSFKIISLTKHPSKRYCTRNLSYNLRAKSSGSCN